MIGWIRSSKWYRKENDGKCPLGTGEHRATPQSIHDTLEEKMGKRVTQVQDGQFGVLEPMAETQEEVHGAAGGRE